VHLFLEEPESGTSALKETISTCRPEE